MKFELDYSSSKGEDAIFTALERVLKEDEITNLCMNNYDLEITLKSDYKVVIKDYNSFVVNKEQLDEQEELYRKAQNELEEKIQKYGIPLNI